jgi:hypothetical protein
MVDGNRCWGGARMPRASRASCVLRNAPYTALGVYYWQPAAKLKIVRGFWRQIRLL